MSSDNVKLLSMWASVFGMRAVIALKEKGVQFEYHEEDLSNKSQLLLSSNPVHKKIPILIHNGKPICESLIVVEYIDEAWPSQDKCDFLPDDPYQRAVARFWADFVDRKVFKAAYDILVSPDGELRERARKEFADSCVTLESGLREVSCGKPYFGGDSIGLVDIAFAPLLCWFNAYESKETFKLPSEEHCSDLTGWYERLAENASIKEVMEFTPREKLFAYGEVVRKRVLEDNA